MSNFADGQGSTNSWVSSNAAQLSGSLVTRLNEITEIVVALGAGDLSAAGQLPAPFDGIPGGALLANGQGAITDSSGNDLIIAGQTVTTGNGDNTQSYQGEKSRRWQEAFAASVFHNIRSAKLALTIAYLFGELFPATERWAFFVAMLIGRIPIARRAISAARASTPFRSGH